MKKRSISKDPIKAAKSLVEVVTGEKIQPSIDNKIPLKKALEFTEWFALRYDTEMMIQLKDVDGAKEHWKKHMPKIYEDYLSSV